MHDDALLAVCRTTYRRVLAQGGALADAKDAAQAELCHAGFTVTADTDEMTRGMQTVIVMLVDGRYVQRDALDRWGIERYPAQG